MLVVDIIALGLIALGAFSGHKKGLVGILVSFASLILSIVLAFSFQSIVANGLYDSGIGKTLQSTIHTELQDQLQNNEDINGSVYGKLIQKTTPDETIEVTSERITRFILKGVSFVAILLIVHLICYILQMVLNLVFNLPILNTINGMGGTIVGAISVLIKIWIALAIISFISPIPAFSGIMNYINQTILIKFLYNNNILVAIIKLGLGL